LARLAREAVIATRVVHPNVVSVIDVSVAEGGFLFIVMELVDGAPLNAHRELWCDLAWVVPVLVQIAEGLAALHGAGVVHRDLKPANILLARDGDKTRVKITDFGVSRPMSVFDADSSERAARVEASTTGMPQTIELKRMPATAGTSVALRTPSGFADSEAIAMGAVALDTALLDGFVDDAPSPTPPSPPVDGAVTKTGMLVGTPAYMPPELADRRRKPLASADIFAFGVIAFELCTGDRPFEHPPVLASLGGDAPPAPESLASRCPAAPAALVELVAACLDVDHEKRPTASAVAARLRGLQR
jgi:serine/threonine-protein kinase